MSKKRVLVIYFSFSSQTRNLVRAIIEGLNGSDISVNVEVLKLVHPLHFPLKTYPRTLKMMFITCFRPRFEIEPIDPQCLEKHDLIVLAGPTWSYNPSGPILSFLDRYGNTVLKGNPVIPLISCRGYWRLHHWGLRRLLNRCGATVIAPLIFTHTTKEPWRTIGVFLKLAGKVPESGKSWFRRYYPKYGHSQEQIADAGKIGKTIADYLSSEKDLNDLSFPKPIPFKEIAGRY